MSTHIINNLGKYGGSLKDSVRPLLKPFNKFVMPGCLIAGMYFGIFPLVMISSIYLIRVLIKDLFVLMSDDYIDVENQDALVLLNLLGCVTVICVAGYAMNVAGMHAYLAHIARVGMYDTSVLLMPACQALKIVLPSGALCMLEDLLEKEDIGDPKVEHVVIKNLAIFLFLVDMGWMALVVNSVSLTVLFPMLATTLLFSAFTAVAFAAVMGDFVKAMALSLVSAAVISSPGVIGLYSATYAYLLDSTMKALGIGLLSLVGTGVCALYRIGFLVSARENVENAFNGIPYKQQSKGLPSSRILFECAKAVITAPSKAVEMFSGEHDETTFSY